MSLNNFICGCFMLYVCLIYVNCTTVKRHKVEGYYWRDYAGFIPHDAFPGGNENGNITYIGQVLFNNLLVPARIISGKAYFEFGFNEHVSEENIKILCSDNHKLLQWQNRSNADFNNFRHTQYIVGGYEPKAEMYIGRFYKNGEIILGKVLVNEAAILHATKNGKSVESTNFEILYYDDPNKNAAVNTQAYYWRDYVGVIPDDALPGGTEGGSITYISQVLYNNLLVPGKLIPSERKAQFEWGREAHVAEENVKIFCTNKPERFHWLSSSSSAFKEIKDSNLVVAGHERTGVLYIGRTKAGSDVVVGKLLVNNDVVLHTAQNGRAVQSRVFEVLYYEPES